MFDKDGHKIGDRHQLTPQVGNRDKKFYDDFDKFDYPQKQVYNYHAGKKQ